MLRRWQINSIVFILCFISCNNNEQQQKEAKYEVATIEIKNMKFVPDFIEVKKGDTIVFVNRDMVNHCVTEKTKTWTSGSIPQGQSYIITPDKTTEYFCAIHVVMKGKIIVHPMKNR